MEPLAWNSDHTTLPRTHKGKHTHHKSVIIVMEKEGLNFVLYPWFSLAIHTKLVEETQGIGDYLNLCRITW